MRLLYSFILLQPSLPDCTKDGGVPENSNVPDRYGSSDKVLDTPVSIEEVVSLLNWHVWSCHTIDVQREWGGLEGSE